MKEGSESGGSEREWKRPPGSIVKDSRASKDAVLFQLDFVMLISVAIYSPSRNFAPEIHTLCSPRREPRGREQSGRSLRNRDVPWRAAVAIYFMS